MTCKYCDSPATARQMCGRHYQQWWKTGRVSRRTRFDPNPIRRYKNYAEIGLMNAKQHVVAWAKIDLEDIEKVQTRRWGLFTNRHKQYVVNGKGTNSNGTLYLHRFLLKPPREKVVDHINGNGLDNRRSNLRVCSVRENNRNSTRSRAGYARRGVTPRKGGGYTVSIAAEVSTLKEAIKLREALEAVAWGGVGVAGWTVVE